MGCDIHAFYEVQDDNGKWVFHDHLKPYRGADNSVDWGAALGTDLEIGRCYTLFALLADVRNGDGFAGIDTGDPIVPASEPRGVPEDASAEYQAEADSWGGDGHSHSWFTLAELLPGGLCDWDQMLTCRCYISLEHYKEFRARGVEAITESCGDVWVSGIVKLSMTEADALLEGMADSEVTRRVPKAEKDTKYMVRIQYAIPLRRDLQWFLDSVLPAMAKLHSDPHKVRMVFFFDN